jgi:hypothetical protein
VYTNCTVLPLIHCYLPAYGRRERRGKRSVPVGILAGLLYVRHFARWFEKTRCPEVLPCLSGDCSVDVGRPAAVP